jgi:hypothetical protein
MKLKIFCRCSYFLPGRARDLSAPMYNNDIRCRVSCTVNHDPQQSAALALTAGYTISPLTLNLLKTTIVAPPSNASNRQMGFNSAFKGLNKICPEKKRLHVPPPKRRSLWEAARLICKADIFQVTVVLQQHISQRRDLGVEQGGTPYSFKYCRQHQHLKIGPATKAILFTSLTKPSLLLTIIIWTSEAAEMYGHAATEMSRCLKIYALGSSRNLN